jgi:hypothetical protein
MMSLFDENELAIVLHRINKLTPDSRPNWGKMNVSQMLAHCQTTLNLALGKATLKRSILGFLFGKIAKKQVVSDKPFKRNLPTAPSFIIKDEKNFELEKQKLTSLVTEFSKGGSEGLSNKPHPFFGPLTPEEWDKSQWKHLDHHLQQFGV